MYPDAIDSVHVVPTTQLTKAKIISKLHEHEQALRDQVGVLLLKFYLHSL